MRRVIQTLVAIAAVLLWTTQAFAGTWTVYSGGVRYQIDGDKNQATIMGLQSGYEDITELVFPSSKVAGGDSYDYPITKVNIQAFYNSKLKKVDMSKLTSLKEFDYNGFMDSKDLTEIILPEGLQRLGVSTFKGCSSLKEITLPSTLLSIGNYDFEGTALTELTIPANVNYVGMNIFAFWDSLLRINMENPVPPTGFDDKAFSEILRRRPDLALFVPVGSVDDYQASEWWSSRFTNIKSDDLGDVFNYGHFRYELKESSGTRYVDIVGVADDNGTEYEWMLDMEGVQYNGRIYPVWNVQPESCKDYRWAELDLSRNMFKDLMTIGKEAFFGNTTITKVKLADDIWWIGESAFAWCSNLESVDLPYYLKTIDYEAFRRCINLKRVTFGPKLLNIKERAFDDCWELKSVYLPANLQEVGYRAFSSSGLEWMILSPNTKMSYESMLGCNKLKYIFPMYSDPTATTSAKNIFFMSDSPGTLDATVIVPSGKLNAYKSSDWGKVFSDIRDTTVGLTLDNDTVIYSLDTNMQMVVSGEFIDTDVSLGYASIIGLSPNCENYDVEIHGISGIGFKGVQQLGPLAIWATKIGKRAFKDNKQLKSFDISEMPWLDIEYQAFAGCSNLTSIGDGTTVTFIRDEAFMGSGLEQFTYNHNLQIIGSRAFANCQKLKRVDYIDDGYGGVSIGNSAFEDCSALEWLNIGSTVYEIGYSAFANCTALKRVTSGINPPYAIDESVFEGIVKESVPLYVPHGTIDAYKTTDGWKDFFGNNIKDTNDGLQIDDGVFVYEIYDSGTSSDNDADMAMIVGLSPDISQKKAVMDKPAITLDGRDYPVNMINSYAFQNLVFVDEMDFSAADQTLVVSYQAFYNAKSLKHIKFNESLGWLMGMGAFASATSLEDIVITSNVAPSAFSGCTKLKDVSFTSDCSYIGDYAFDGCTSLEEISLPRGAEMTIYSNAFSNSGLKKLIIPDCYPFYIQEDAFDGSQLTEVISYIEWPEDLHSDAFNGIPENATLKVPYGQQYEYEYRTGWDHFYGHIEEMPYIPTGIDSSTCEPVDSSTVYDLQGRRISDNPSSLKRGIYIIGGKKVMVK